MSYDWRGDPIWANLSPDDKWAAMTLMEADHRNINDAKNVAHAIYNRSQLLGLPIDKHLNTGGRHAGTYQPLWEANQRRGLPSILASKQFQEMRKYVAGVRDGSNPDTTGGATRYLVSPQGMYRLSGGVHMTAQGWRGNSSKYYSWPGWTGFDPKTMGYKGETFKDTSHHFLIPDEDRAIAAKRGYVFGKPVAPQPTADQVVSAVFNKEAPKPEQAPQTPVQTQDTSPGSTPSVSNAVEAPQEAPGGVSGVPGVSVAEPTDAAPEPNDGLPAIGAGTLQGDPGDQGDTEPVKPPSVSPTTVDPWVAPSTTTIEPYNPRTFKEADEARTKAIGDTFDPLSWGELFHSVYNTTTSIQTAEEFFARSVPEEQFIDPNFVAPEDVVKSYSEEKDRQALLDAPNEAAFQLRKARIDDRVLARKEWERAKNTSSFDYYGGTVASLIPDMAIGIALGIPFASAGRSAVSAAGIGVNTRLGRAIIGALDGGGGAAVEAAIGQHTDILSPEEAEMYIAMGGFFGGALHAVFGREHVRAGGDLPPDVKRKYAEAAEDHFDDIEERDGKSLPKGADPKGEIANTDVPARVKLDEKKTPFVNRDTHDKEAVTRYDEDAKVLDSAFNEGRGGSSNEALGKSEEAFNRQSYRSQEKQTVYVVADAADTTGASAFSGKLARGFRDVQQAIAEVKASIPKTVKAAKDAALRVGDYVDETIHGVKEGFGFVRTQAGKEIPVEFREGAIWGREGDVMIDPRTLSAVRNGGKGKWIDVLHPEKPKPTKRILKVTIPALSRVIEGGKLEGIGRDGEVIFGHGKIGEARGEPKKAGASEHTYTSHTFNSETKSKGNPQMPYAYAKATGERIPPEKLHDDNALIFDEGVTDTLANREKSSTGSLSAHRVTEDRYAIDNMSENAKKAVDANEPVEGRIGAPPKESFFKRSIAFSISRAAQLMASDNPMVRVVAPYLMGGMLDLSRKAIKAGMVRPIAADDIKNSLTRAYSYQILSAEKKNYGKWLKARREAGEKRYADWMLREEFNAQVTAYARAMDEVGHIDLSTVKPGVKEHAEAMSKVYMDFAEFLRDPGKATNRPGLHTHPDGTIKAVGGLEHMPSRPWYTPRMWDIDKINLYEATHGPGSFNDFIHDSMRSKLGKYGWIAVDGKQGRTGLSNGQIRTLADAMANKIKLGRSGWSNWTDAAFGHGDPEDLLLKLKEAGVDDETIKGVREFMILSSDSQGKKTAGAMTHYRGLLDENTGFEMVYNNGSRISRQKDVKVGNFTATNASLNALDYTRKAAGRVALANLDIDDAATGIKVKGIYSDADIAKFKKELGETAAALQLKNSGGVFSDSAIIDNYFEMMTNTYPKAPNQFMRFIQMIAGGRLLGGAGFAQIGEAVNGIAIAGSNAIYRMGNVRQMAREIQGAFSSGNHEIQTPLGRLAMDGFGLNGDVTRLFGSAGVDDLHTMYMSNSGPGFQYGLKAAMKNFAISGAAKFQNATLKYSGLTPITGWLHIRLFEAMHDTLLQQAIKYGSVDKMPRRLKTMWQNAGLSHGDIDTLLTMYKDPTVVLRVKDTPLTQVHDFDFSHVGFHHATFHKANEAIVRLVHKSIQENNWGAMPPGFDNPTVKLITQLRSFMFASFTKQLVNNTKQFGQQIAQLGSDLRAGNFSAIDGAGDSALGTLKAGMAIFPQMVAGVVMAALIDEVRHAGQDASHAKKRRDHFWQTPVLLEAAASRSGMGSTVPFIFDSTVGQFTGKQFGGYRSSGQAESIFGNPVVSLGKDIGKGIGSAASIFMGKGDTNDAKNAAHLVLPNLWFTDMGVDIVAGHMLKQHKQTFPNSTFGGLVDIKK